MAGEELDDLLRIISETPLFLAVVQQVRETQAMARRELVEFSYHNAAFGSMYVTYSVQGKALRIVWDGKEGVVRLEGGIMHKFGTFGAWEPRVHPEIMWAKFRSLVEGARIASGQLWKRGAGAAS